MMTLACRLLKQAVRFVLKQQRQQEMKENKILRNERKYNKKAKKKGAECITKTGALQ